MTLTPYDQGTVLEPRTWVTSSSGVTRDGGNIDDFGRVDFDNDEGSTEFAGLRILPDREHVHATLEFSTSLGSVTIDCLDPGIRLLIAFKQDEDTRERAVERAQRAIDIIADRGEDPSVQLVDVLVDLLHWAKTHGIVGVDYDELLDTAYDKADSEDQEWSKR
jgi:hypothetical protein